MSRLSDRFNEKLTAYNRQPVVVNDWGHFITFDVMVTTPSAEVMAS